MKWEAEAVVSVVRSMNISGSDGESWLLCAIASWNDVVEDQTETSLQRVENFKIEDRHLLVAKTVDIMITYVLVI